VVPAIDGYLARASGGRHPGRDAVGQAEQELARPGGELDRYAAVRPRQGQVDDRFSRQLTAAFSVTVMAEARFVDM
jgi:hypothetical protein